MKEMMLFTLTCVDQNQINAANIAINDFINEQALSNTKIILKTPHVLAIQSNRSNKEAIRTFAITVSAQSPAKLPLIYEEQAVLDNGSIRDFGWTILDGKCKVTPIEDASQILDSCEHDER